MLTRQMPILFLFLTFSKVESSALMAHSETLCSLNCHTSPRCSGYAFKDLEAFLDDGNDVNWTGNCFLLEGLNLIPGIQAPPLPQGFEQNYLVKTSKFTHTIDIPGEQTFDEDPVAAGYDLSINAGNSTVFLKEVNLDHTYDEAMLECLRHGGILPMESDDDFVEQMSLLSGDPTTPRFISLATEQNRPPQEMHLVWTLGQEEWKETASPSVCPRCQNWVFDSEAKIQWAKINPESRLYEPVVPGEKMSKYYCQFLGGNLATHKRVQSSSVYTTSHQPDAAVDGIAQLGAPFWHSGNGPPSGEWISINIGSVHWITNVLFLGLLDNYSFRNRDLEVWIGGPEPSSGADFDLHGRTLCGIYQFWQRDSQLSGMACPYPMKGFVVTIRIPVQGHLINFMEFAVYGFKALE